MEIWIAKGFLDGALDNKCLRLTIHRRHTEIEHVSGDYSSYILPMRGRGSLFQEATFTISGMQGKGHRGGKREGYCILEVRPILYNISGQLDSI